MTTYEYLHIDLIWCEYLHLKFQTTTSIEWSTGLLNVALSDKSYWLLDLLMHLVDNHLVNNFNISHRWFWWILWYSATNETIPWLTNVGNWLLATSHPKNISLSFIAWPCKRLHKHAQWNWKHHPLTVVSCPREMHGKMLGGFNVNFVPSSHDKTRRMHPAVSFHFRGNGAR